jgi:two-component system, NtrC family, sensor histidine kinase HydH
MDPLDDKTAAEAAPLRTPPWRWWGLVAGIGGGIFDIAMMRWLGVTFALNGYDASAWVALYFAISFASLGFMVGFLAEQRRRERHSAALLQTQTETINATRARLLQSEKLAALGQLAAQIAHEVRNPLGVIRSAAQGLGETVAAGDPDAERACSFILAEIDRLNSVITSLLAFARPLQVEARAVTVAQIFERALLLAREDFAEKQISVSQGDTAALPAVAADTDLMSQVVLDLLNNAAQSVPRAGEVRLEARAEEGRVSISVSDSGPGVPAELRSRVFEPFFTTRPRGTGLGLAIARQIVQAHGGDISVGERRGGGACFTISLPAAAGKLAA